LRLLKQWSNWEKEHGWLQGSKDIHGRSFESLEPETKANMAARECQRLGLMFQVTGLHTSFAAVEDGGFEVLARGTLSKHPPKIHMLGK
jgi:hypothetical protein